MPNITGSTERTSSVSSLASHPFGLSTNSGTDTAQSASEGNIPFPEIPDVNTMISLNLTRQPTFFGCHDSSPTPLVLYLPNSPWSAYSNFSYTQTSFTDQQVNLTLGNAFQLATYGNGTVDDAWPACLACAVIRGSISRLGTSDWRSVASVSGGTAGTGRRRIT
jgi:hypothetical protein